MNAIIPNETSKHWGRQAYAPRLEVIQRAAEKSGAKILDFGCGRGSYVARLRELSFDCVGVDISVYPEWEAYEAQFETHIFDRIEDEVLPHENDQFDIVFAYEVLEHCADPLAVLMEIKRVCSRDIILSVPDCRPIRRFSDSAIALNHYTDPAHVQRFTRSTLLDLLSRAGLNVQYLVPDYRVDMNAFVWSLLRTPRWLKSIGRKMCGVLNMFPIYYTSIRAHARKEA